MNAYLNFFASTLLTSESNIADEALPTDSLTLKQKGERVIRNSTAGRSGAGRHNPSSPLPLSGCASSRFPSDSGSWAETYPLCPLLGRERVGCPVRVAGGIGREGVSGVTHVP